ncbi:MAG: hypothetical protein NTZ68_00640 [Candidatus Dependentiae bacterium]|nr:hypothetical protein [Candidatus Dependentiae bacterium]
MKIQTLLLMTAVTMVTLVPRISAMCRFGTKTVAAQMASGMAARGLCTTSHTQFNASGSQSADSQSKKYNFADMFKAMRNNKKKIMAGLVIANDAYEYQFNSRGQAYEISQKGLRQTLKDIPKEIDKGIDKKIEERYGKFVPCENEGFLDGEEYLDVFEELKARMGVCKEYKLYRCSKNSSFAAEHNGMARIITLAPMFFWTGPSEQMRMLCHELQHARQVDFRIAQSFICNDEYFRDERSKNAEQDAEATAARMITCAQCLKRCQKSAHESGSDAESQGYYTKLHFEPHIQEALKNDKPCIAHAKGESSWDLRNYLPQKESK